VVEGIDTITEVLVIFITMNTLTGKIGGKGSMLLKKITTVLLLPYNFLLFHQGNTPLTLNQVHVSVIHLNRG